MEYRCVGDKIAVRLDEGEDLVAKLLSLVRDEGIGFAVVNTGCGTVSRVFLGTYDPDKRENYENNYCDVYDLAALSGVLGGAGEPWADLRAVIANVRLHSDIRGFGENVTDREPGVAYGGKLKSARVRVGCAVVLERLELAAHLAGYLPPDPAPPGRLGKALKGFVGYSEPEEPTVKLEFD